MMDGGMMKSSRKNSMGNEVPLNAREAESSRSATTNRMSFGFHSDRSHHPTASDENAPINAPGSPRRRRMSYDESKPASAKVAKNQRLPTRINIRNHSNTALGPLPPLLGQAQRRMSVGGAQCYAPHAHPPFAAISTPDSRTKRCTPSTNQASGKRPRNGLSNHGLATAAARCSQLPLAHRGPPDGGTSCSRSGSDSLHSGQESVATDAIQVHPPNASGSILCVQYERGAAPRQIPDDAVLPDVPVNNENVAPSAFPAPSPPSFDHLDAIRDAVRAYTLLPKSERSSDCEPVRAIRELTGYVLTSPVSFSPSTPRVESGAAAATHGLLGSPSVTTRAHKADVLHKLGGDDIFRSLDACKLRDASVALQGTQCRPEKDRGFYRYVHVPTGTEIAAMAYEERYIAVLNEACTRKWRYLSHYFDLLKQHDEEKQKEMQAVAPSLSSAQQGNVGSESASMVATKTPTSSTPARLLPLPSRDEASSDPEIAEAERELWDKIDAALEEYSHKVLMIQENRRGDREC
jgi:hypothetical protein